MSNTLGRIAAAGLGTGVVCLAIAWTIGGHDLDGLWQHDRWAWRGHGCERTATADNASAERRLAWTGGDTIEIALPATVHFRAGEGPDLIVRGAPDAVANVEIRGNRLVLDCRAPGRVDVTLPGTAFRRIGVSGWANVRLENLNQPELVFTLSGSGDLVAQGTVDRLTATISGSGNARLGDVALKQLTVRISGSGNVEAAPKEAADIKLSGSGSVRLLTRPAHLSSHVSGSGRISQVAETEGKK
ncbi:MAG TPA: DUF2807 domain-containing protein [Reyranella sp.]|nr:DUF2807 domain-containing protein [Reyranella sp.]